MIREQADGKELTLQVLDIVPGTTVDGPGLRTSVYLAGCAHHCPGCHNPDSWDVHGGRTMTVAQIMEIIEDNGFNVTLTGGDPMMQAAGVMALATAARAAGYEVWCYTGYTWQQVRDSAGLAPVLDVVDVLVDGRFEPALRDTSLIFRGSSNQRIVEARTGNPLPGY